MNSSIEHTTAQVIEGMARELSTAAPEAMQIYTKGLQIQGVLGLTGMILSVLAALLVGKRLWPSRENFDTDHGYENAAEGVVVAAVVVFLMTAAIWGVFVQPSVMRIVAPDFVMIQDLAAVASQSVP